jgi:hypothetical protein
MSITIRSAQTVSNGVTLRGNDKQIIPVTILSNIQVDSSSYLLTNGNAFFFISSHPEIGTIPSGASITTNIAGFGTRTVSFVSEYLDYYVVNYDGTGLSGYASLSDTYTFTWIG